MSTHFSVRGQLKEIRRTEMASAEDQNAIKRLRAAEYDLELQLVGLKTSTHSLRRPGVFEDFFNRNKKIMIDWIILG